MRQRQTKPLTRKKERHKSLFIIPDNTVSRYRIYVRLATDSVPADSTLVELAGKVAALNELKLPTKSKEKEDIQ